MALVLLAWVAVPPVLKSQIEQRGSSLLGREVRVGRVAFAPWSLTLTIEQLRIAGAAASASAPPMLEVARVYASADMSSLVKLAPVLDAVEIDAPVLRIARTEAGRYDLDDVVARLSATPPNAATEEPARFALYNLSLRDGRIEFDDRPVQRVHRLSHLTITLPFLSNLPTDVKVNVQPRVAFEVDGAKFDTGGQSRPFDSDHAAALEMQVSQLDLAPWLPYLPAGLPVRPTRGVLAGQWHVQFSLAPDGTPRVALKGRTSLSDAALAASGAAGVTSAPLAAWQRLEVTLDDVRPLERTVALGAVTLAGARVDLRRGADGRLALPMAAPAQATPAQATPASTPSSTPAARPWDIRIGRIDVVKAQVAWSDASTRPAAVLRLHDLDVQAGPLRWPLEQGVPWRVSSQLKADDARIAAAQIEAEGQASERDAQATVAIDRLTLSMLRPYLDRALRVHVDGVASARAALSWSRAEPTLALSAAELKLRDVAVREPGARGEPLARLGALAMADAAADLHGQRVQLGRVKIDRPMASLKRTRDGTLDIATWVRGADGAAAATAAAPPQARNAPPWQIALDDLQLERGELRWRDELPAAAGREIAPDAEGAPTVQVLARDVNVRIQRLAWPNGPAARTQGRLTLVPGAARDGAGAAAGRLAWTASVAPEPFTLRGTVTAERLPVHAFAPYVDRDLPIALLRGDASYRGDVALALKPGGAEVAVRGDARVDDLRVHERQASQRSDELLTWHSLVLDGLRYEQAPGTRARVALGMATLSDFYSRLVVTEDGHFNLRDVAATPSEGPATAAPAVLPASAPAAPPAAQPDTLAALPLDLQVGGVRLVEGRIDFTDRFIKPNYSAALTALNGRLGAFNSSSRDMATLELRGRAAGTALLEIVGSLNPSVKPLALDLRAKATDLELAPLSPYAGRYAGYAIERGKLSMDVAYRIAPDGKLDAKNQIVLNQLTFGEKVESPDATKLPVLLAVSLLKDRHGVIDINLPISGSINDPQFSVFGIVLKVIGNLLVKALTAPFSLLAGGDAADLSFVGFAPGTTRFTDNGRGVIDKVAQALLDRPALQMTVTGAADPASERDAIQSEALEARLRAEQRRDALRAGATPDAPLPALGGAARDALVRRVYADTRLPNKPRNVIGLAKDIPVPEMEALLRQATVVSTDSARELALQRGLAVRDALIAKGLPSERLFVAAPRLRASGEEDAAWSPRVQLVLGTR
ncbi:MAG TPA: DUF748 domain-containing protein [Burkholderiaceae bacterium]|nr:DUF748 domain-containing protein [Burkholderiaceae bacterium]